MGCLLHNTIQGKPPVDFNELVAKEFMELHREILAEQKKTNELLGRII